MMCLLRDGRKSLNCRDLKKGFVHRIKYDFFFASKKRFQYLFIGTLNVVEFFYENYFEDKC